MSEWWKFNPRVQSVLARIELRFGVDRTSLFGPDRHRQPTLARHVFFWAMRRYGFASTEIGEICYRDHSTVIQGARRIARELQRDVRLAEDVAFVLCEPLAATVPRVSGEESAA